GMETNALNAPSPLPARERRTPGPHSPLVLVVEDDPVLRSTLSWNLERDGYRVEVAADGLRGLETARREAGEVSLYLLDVMLPGLDGFQVLRGVREVSQAPVLMLTARGGEQDRVDGLELGADDYIVKPFVMRELLARVRAAIRRSAAPGAKPPVAIQRGDLAVELDRQRAAVGGRELALRPKEFGLLATLAMEPGRIFSRTELLDRIWGEESIVDERTVDVHISWLRGKLAAAGMRPPPIQTAYGRGYRFAVDGSGAAPIERRNEQGSDG
ncbi:MAG: response regulator transcription factor, partial [Chloroflexota bacterium]